MVLAQATLDDVVGAVDNLYVAVSDNSIAVQMVADMVYTIRDYCGQVYSLGSLVGFFVLFLVGWVIYGRLRRGRLFSH